MSLHVVRSNEVREALNTRRARWQRFGESPVRHRSLAVRQSPSSPPIPNSQVPIPNSRIPNP
ncbi:hypothetical protein, partial [Xanthomonas phaseoli]|uniref:hypothetical protein n=1 Tax=Xanthomonas phaseoli TaxID=1985254 RepID=UPI001969B15C